MFLVDTNVISEVRKRHGLPQVKAWMAAVPDDNVYVSVLVLGEIRRGIERLRHSDPPQASSLDFWLAGLYDFYYARILPISAEIADIWGRLSISQPLPPIDGLMAATALQHRLTVVTRNVTDFARCGVPAFNPFSS